MKYNILYRLRYTIAPQHHSYNTRYGIVDEFVDILYTARKIYYIIHTY